MNQNELRTDQLKPGMKVRLKNKSGTLEQNDWFEISKVELCPCRYWHVSGTGMSWISHERQFLAHTKWMVESMSEPNEIEIIREALAKPIAEHIRLMESYGIAPEKARESAQGLIDGLQKYIDQYETYKHRSEGN